MGDRPSVGVGVIVRKEGKVLLGKRTSSHGSGTWSMPGGHLEYGEDITACARRETKEEAGIEITNLSVETITNDHFQDDEEHYITIFVTADHAAGEPTVEEPEKCAEWRWVDWDDMPQPLFLPIRNLLQQDFTPRP